MVQALFRGKTAQCVPNTQLGLSPSKTVNNWVLINHERNKIEVVKKKVVVKLYFNTVNPFRRKIIQIILKRDKKGNYTN